MNQKLLFFDIDGTLVADGSSNITESAIRAIKKAQANGHLCFVNTGRPIGSVGDNIQNYPFDGYICGCGTYIKYRKKEILHVEIDPKLVQELIKWNQREKIDIFFEGKEGLVFPPESSIKDLNLVERYFKKQGVAIQYYQYEEKIDFQTDKFTMWFDPKQPPLEFRSFLEHHFSVIERDIDFWEVIPKGYSKATGIDDLLKHLNMDIADTISFGDSVNDISMLEHTEQSVLMGNGAPELKDLVTYVTTDVREDGIYRALKHFRLI
ncbi:MAG: Cof-type HAD-IIB family hydrolase [Lachnospiraceae bacterium]|nr:Cof-type HAD-IIB family hydrolase [Lachnospiraceae bacterium]